MQRFLLDTSVILDNTENLVYLHHKHHELYISDIILEELDRKKDSQSESGFFAREFFRCVVLDSNVRKLTNNDEINIYTNSNIESLPSDYISRIEFKSGEVYVPIWVITRTKYKTAFLDYGYNDAKIREIAKDYKLVLLTNDIALRVRSLADNIQSQSIKRGQVLNPKDIEFIYKTKLLRDLSDKITFEKSKAFQALSQWHIIEIEEIDYTDSECYLTGKKLFGVKHNDKLDILELDSIIKEHKPYILPLNIEQKLAYVMLTYPHNQLSIITGSTGSGKTLIALQAGISLQKMGLVDGIIYMRNTITANDKEAELGFRKGDEIQKLHYFMYPLFSSVNFIIESLKENSLAKRIEYKGESKGIDKEEATQYFLKKHRIEIMDIAHARGISLHNKFVIFDEVQNASDATIKLIGTRLGEGSRIVFLGDYNQIDHPYLSKFRNGALSLLSKAKEDDFLFGLQLKYTIRSQIANWFDSKF
ncbi:phosphate starvation-inducible protein PhoH [Helicobacter muridarum]|uniref:Phosphate starvation-induced protein n=1 Tax=Helicobacter muridarum TaxID=216 RepID=A0A099U1C6_9HELI|nr:PhoH family protein [Helicobacter muridarum]TLE01102.1 phosphate starvation-inducible protein PhoH [Helicobacter muridarum]STQ85966.1 phosphate starvation-induced protein [Helicobacter muridarum]